MAIKWKQIRGHRMASGWNSTALWSQISCPLHLLIQDHWSRRQFNLLSRVWLVMIYWEPFVLQPKPAQQSFWWIIYFSCGIFKLYLKRNHRVWTLSNREELCPLVISRNWRNMLLPPHSKSSRRGHQLRRQSWKDWLTGLCCSQGHWAKYIIPGGKTISR